MQTRYLAFIGRDRDAMCARFDRIGHRADGRMVALGDRIALWLADEAAITRMAGGRMLAVGHLHRHPEASAIAVFAETICTADNLAELAQRAWGAYIAFDVDAERGICTVFRAPMGALPCYHCAVADGWLVASDVDLLFATGLIGASIHWDGLAGHLASAMTIREETCLSDVREIPPGCALQLGQGGAGRIRPVWSWWDHVVPDASSPDETIETLRSRIFGTIRSMASEHRKLAASVSGGLDSSIVLACLRRAEVPVHPFTFVGADPDADETRYVRPLACHLDVPLREFRFDAGDIDLSCSSASHLPRPTGEAHAQMVAARYRLLQAEFGIDAVMTGMGGDSVFCTTYSALPLVDHVRQAGLSWAPLATWAAVRRITGAPFSTIIRQALRIAFAGRRPDWSAAMKDFLSRDLADDPPDPLGADWLRPPADVFPGKRYHVEMLARTLPALEGFARRDHPALLSPLMAQPVVELCLHIPTWQWARCGLPRSVARDAFRPWLPEALVQRRSKGGPDSVSRDIVMAQRAMVRAILLDGVLVQRGLLDRTALEAALTDQALLGRAQHSALLHIVDTEAWLAHWRGAAAGTGVAR